MFKAISDPTRRRILSLLRKRSMTAGEIAEHFDLAKSTLSGHFNVLKNAGLILEEKRRNQVFYSLNMSVVEELLTLVTGIFSKGKKEGSNDQDKEAGVTRNRRDHL
jgi:DNA-binding transcriptional ArsR family regulator